MTSRLGFTLQRYQHRTLTQAAHTRTSAPALALEAVGGAEKKRLLHSCGCCSSDSDADSTPAAATVVVAKIIADAAVGDAAFATDTTEAEAMSAEHPLLPLPPCSRRRRALRRVARADAC